MVKNLAVSGSVFGVIWWQASRVEINVSQRTSQDGGAEFNADIRGINPVG